MRLTVRHRYDFGAGRAVVGDNLVRAEAWDAVRMGSDPAFALPDSRWAWDAEADRRQDIAERAVALDRVLGEGRVASYGVGAALCELWLHRLRPGRELVMTDYAPRAVERLAELFPEALVERHDLRSDPPLAADTHLLHRVDSELSNSEWRVLLQRFARERIVIVATEMLRPRRLLEELMLRRPGSGASDAGWIRTRGAFEALWRPTHDAQRLTFYDLEGWILQPRN